MSTNSPVVVMSIAFRKIKNINEEINFLRIFFKTYPTIFFLNNYLRFNLLNQREKNPYQ